jgi:metal-responsive CopG/Arc/MetJ family transcriptional regulator
MKTTISIPDPIFESAEKLAKRLGISRSQLYSEAVEAYVDKQSYSGVTEQLDAVMEARPGFSQLEKGFEKLQIQALGEHSW